MEKLKHKLPYLSPDVETIAFNERDVIATSAQGDDATPQGTMLGDAWDT